jgi:hypothetical protein
VPTLNVCFSNRPSGVKRFQAIHHSSVDVAHGLPLLFGLGTKALPSWDSKTRWNNLLGDVAVNVTAGSSGHTNSPHPSSREGHHSTAGGSSSFLLSHLILHRSQGAATSRVHRNAVPSTHMRCMITASRRASATIAFFGLKQSGPLRQERERVSISDFGSQSEMGLRSRRHWAFCKCPRRYYLGNPPIFKAIVFGKRLSIGTVGEQADNLEATRRAAAYQDCHRHYGVGVCQTLSSADVMAITKWFE